MIGPMEPAQWNAYREFVQRRWVQGMRPGDIAIAMASRFKREVHGRDVRRIAAIIGLPEYQAKYDDGSVQYARKDPWPATHNFYGQDVPDRDGGTRYRMPTLVHHMQRPEGASS